jgi:hypothetical protein
MDDEDEDSGDENVRASLKKIGMRKGGFNIRKITADFNSYQIDSQD